MNDFDGFHFLAGARPCLWLVNIPVSTETLVLHFKLNEHFVICWTDRGAQKKDWGSVFICNRADVLQCTTTTGNASIVSLRVRIWEKGLL